MADTPTTTLDAIEANIADTFLAIRTESELRNVYSKLLGKEGTVSLLMKRMPEISATERKTFGQKVNAVKAKIEQARTETETRLKQEARNRELNSAPLDITLPGRKRSFGRMHPLSRVIHDMLDVFSSLGFDIAEGPEVELAEYNFERLGFPPDHPAIDMQDTFFISSEIQSGSQRPLLRTHTSPVQIREMLAHPPPIRIVAPGFVYRRDDDVTHSPMFMQIEGLVVDRGVNMSHLRGLIDAFVHRMFGDKIKTRLRASYFPFVEPGAELDMECLLCNGKDRSCRICKGSGWIEVLGCGMVDPVVFQQVGYDPEEYTGFALGMGVDRTAMLRYRVPDIRLLYENDTRFLESL